MPIRKKETGKEAAAVQATEVKQPAEVAQPAGIAQLASKGAEEARIHELVKLAYHALDDKKAENITVIDISALSVVADYFIIASGDNLRQTAALCEHVEETLGRAGFLCRQTEGRQGASWILMDYGDVIIHIFDKENRLFYDLERIWKDGHRVVDVDSLA